MSPPLQASDVAIGLLTEDTPRMLAQAVRLLRSIRWFGGGLGRARIVVCAVGSLAGDAREALEGLGAETRIVSRFHPANPTGNRHELLAELLDAPQRVLFLLDCDTIVVRDPLPFLNGDAFQAKIAPTPTVSDEVFDRLFAHFKLPKPARTHIARLSGTPTIPYFNAGVLAIPTALARTLAPVWRKYNLTLAEHPHLAAPCQRHMHQASLSLALVAAGVPYAEMPEALNYQINATHIAAPPGFAELDPVIIHYHHLATDDGFLLPCPYPGAQARIDVFHDRLRAEGLVREHKQPSPHAQSSRAIVVLGMHRSGTSLVTEILSAMGCHPGMPETLTPPDMFNPTGYWEHREVVDIDEAIMKALSAGWTQDVLNADVSRLTDAQRAEFAARARAVVQSLQGYGPLVLKDPRMSLLFPLWREVLETPVCVIAWRDPFAVARSLWTRDKQPLLVSLAVWEHYNRTLLRDTEGLPRILVSYEELLAEPARIVRVLHEALTGLGFSELTIPPEESIRRTVNPDFNRSARHARRDESLLDADQRALLADLRSGAALNGPVAPITGRTRELLEEFGAAEKARATLRDDIAELDSLLRAVFQSRSWRVGYNATTLLRVLSREKGVSAIDRWEESKRRRRERTS